MKADFHEFVVSWVRPPARVLEVGCGAGELALVLVEAGYDVTAIDPKAPEGAVFRRVSLEEFAADGPFDAVVASLALHHVADFAAGLDKIARLLRPGAVLVLDEFARDRFDEPTARWYYHQRQALAAAGRDGAAVPRSFRDWWREWRQEHADIHPYGTMRVELDRRFAERFFAWTPYLHGYRLDDELEPLERKLIDSGAIQPTGFRYVGERTAPG